MNQLVDVLERLADRGTPRGADAVFDAATSIDVVDVETPWSSRPHRRRTLAFAVALLASAAVLVTVVVVRSPAAVQPALQPPRDSEPATSSTDASLLVGVPGLSSSIADSKPTVRSAAFGSTAADILAARAGTASDLRETATRTTDEGQVLQYAYFAEPDRRLFVLSGGTGLLSSVSGLLDELVPGPTATTGSVLVWPEEPTSRTIAFSTANSVIIVSSEVVTHTGTAWSTADLVDLATKISASDPFATIPLGAPNCSPPTPVIGNEFRGTSDSALLSGLIFATRSSAHVGDNVKYVVRMTGTGPLVVTARGPSGTQISLTPTPHTGSTFDRPGDEWDFSITYPDAGCWQFQLARSDSTADVWFQVSAPE
jgi:hypothetical protein